jgi:hypothetical protein
MSGERTGAEKCSTDGCAVRAVVRFVNGRELCEGCAKHLMRQLMHHCDGLIRSMCYIVWAFHSSRDIPGTDSRGEALLAAVRALGGQYATPEEVAAIEAEVGALQAARGIEEA